MATSAACKTSAKSFAVTALIYSSKRYSDLVIQCQDKTFNVHRNVVCLQSKVISKMVDGEFVEGISGVIKLPENDPAIVEKMIEYMYLGDYSDGRVEPLVEPPAPEIIEEPTPYTNLSKGKKDKKGKKVIRFHVDLPSPPTSSEPAEEPDYITKWPSNWIGAPFTHAQVYAIAEQYDIPSLKELAKDKYAEVIPTEWNSSSFVASLQLMYELTPESDRVLKDAALKMTGQHGKELVERGEFILLCKENGDIAVDVLKALFSVNSVGDVKPCNLCGESQYVAVQPSRVHGSFYCGRCGNWFN